MATIRKGILNSQKIPESIDPDLKIYGVDGLPTKSEHMPNLNVVRTDDAVGLKPADFHGVFPFNEIINENVPNFVEYGQWDEKYNTFDSQSQMVSELSAKSERGNGVFYEHMFGLVGTKAKTAYEEFGQAFSSKIYVKDPNNRYKYVVASGTKFGKTIDFENCIYEMDNMDAYLQEIAESGFSSGAFDPSRVYPVVRYGFNFLLDPSTAVCGYIHFDGTELVRTEESVSLTDSYLQILDNSLPKQEITTSSTFKTLDDNKYWQYNGGTSYTIADFDEIPIPLTPTKRIPKFYVKRGMNPDGTWYEKISKTKHDETWLCHKAFISADDGLEKPYLYVASEIVTSTYRDLREDRGNFKVYGETEYDMFETLFRIAYSSWMSTYDEDDVLIIADLKEFGIDYLDCVLRVDTKYDEILGETLDGVGFGRPFGRHDDPFGTDNDMPIRVADISSFRNVKGVGASSLRVPEYAPADMAMYNFNEIEINDNDIFKYVSIVSEHDDSNPVIRQSSNNSVGPDAFIPITYQALANDIDIGAAFGIDVGHSGTVLFDIPLALAAPNQDIEGMTVDLYVGTNEQLQELYDACANGTIPPLIYVYYVNNVATPYLGDVSGEFGLPIPIYMFGDFEDYLSLFFIGDLTPLGMGLGLVLGKIANVSIPNNNIVIQQQDNQLTLRSIEYSMRSGSFWQLMYALTEEPAFLEKQDKFNPTLMELHTYTKTNNLEWENWSYNNQLQPNDVGIGTGMQSFLGYMMMIFLLVQQNDFDPKSLLRIKYLNSEHFQYDVLLAPVKTRLVMLHDNL